MYLGVAVIYTVSFGILCWKIRKGECPPPPALATRSFAAAAKYHVSDEAFGTCMVITYISPLALAFPLGWLTDKLHPMRTGLRSISLSTLSMLAGYLLVDAAGKYEVFLVIHGVLSGAFFTTTAGLALLLMPRCRFSHFASASMVVVSLANIVASMGLGRVLDLLSNDYQLIYLLATLMAGLAVGGWRLLFCDLRRYGGFTDSVAPGEDPAAVGKSAPPVAH